MIDVIVGLNIVIIIAVLLILTCLKEKIDYYSDGSSTPIAVIVVAAAICFNLVLGKLANIDSERVKLKAKCETLEDVGYRALTTEELQDLSPNQLKEEYLRIGDVYFVTDSTN